MKVMLRHFLRLSLFSTLLVGCTGRGHWSSDLPPKATTDRVAEAVSTGNWDAALRLSSRSSSPLLLLVRQRALYELKEYSKVLSADPIKDSRFAPYDTFLRYLAAFEAKNWDALLSLQSPNDLPRDLKERISILIGESLAEKGSLVEAEASLSKFLSDYRDSDFESDVLYRLADVEWTLGKKEEALKRYLGLYENSPQNGSEDIARKRLMESGRFTTIDTDAHLNRIQKLRRAALFGKAERELKSLRLKVPSERRTEIDLALAQLAIAQREYVRSQSLANKALLNSDLSKEMSIEWRQVLAISLSRRGKSDQAKKEYRVLLHQKPSSQTYETILYRLASLSLDDKEYEEAAKYYNEIRQKFPRGRFVESAHWFEAFSRYQKERKKQAAEAVAPEIELALKLLRKLPSLPDGKNFEPQSLYWRSVMSDLLPPGIEKNASLDELKSQWRGSYYYLLSRENPFQFIENRKVINRASLTIPEAENEALKFWDNISWQRLEAFRSVALQTWAKMELDRFLNYSREGGRSIRYLVAERLQENQDWADLVRWADRYFERSLKDITPGDHALLYHYPDAYNSYVLKSAREFNVSPFLVWGLMREESRFQADVVSPAGALGLMQLMPSLANRIGKQLGDGPQARKSMFDPKRNIRYGTFHLWELKQKVERLPVPDDLKPALQVAAYNAGIEAVERWLKEKESSRIDVFVESIPYAETRQYVKRVLQSASIYYQLYGDGAKEVARAKEKTEL